jgi:hypothetical protein
VRSKVARLRDHSFTVDHTPFCDEVAKEFALMHSVDDLEILNLTMSDFEKDSDLIQFYDEMKVIHSFWLCRASKISFGADDRRMTGYTDKALNSNINYQRH